MIYGHGDDYFNFNGIRANFSSNVNPSGINSGLQAYMKACIEKLNVYPEPLAETLAALIEQRKGLPEGSVLVTNGAVEAFYLLASVSEKKKSLIYTPSFSEYEDACKMYGHSIVFRGNDSFPEELKTDFDSIWICNPNNPDGKIFDSRTIEKQASGNPGTLFVVDEAYAEFTDKVISLEKAAPFLPNMVIVRSLTKRFSIPGLRLGYLVCSPPGIKKLQKKLMPWRINTLALEAGKYCFSDHYSDNFNLRGLLDESRRLQTAINKIEGFSACPSQTSFFLVKGPVKASVLKRELAEKSGILIRDASNFRGLSKNHFRISTQLTEENNRLTEALMTWTWNH